MPENEVLKLSSVENLIAALKAQNALTKEAEEDAKAAAAALGGNIFVVSEDETSVKISPVEPASQFEEKSVSVGGISIEIVTITV